MLQDEPVEGHPVWPMIYYCLRCGDLQAAADIAQQAVAPNVREFSGYIREYSSQGHLTETSVRNMKYAYRKEVRNSLDPFKRYIYCMTIMVINMRLGISVWFPSPFLIDECATIDTGP